MFRGINMGIKYIHTEKKQEKYRNTEIIIIIQLMYIESYFIIYCVWFTP